MESMLGSRRRSKNDIPVLHWWFRNNCLFPSSSRTFRTQSYWSFIAGQCCYSEQLLTAYLPHWMRIQSSLYCQFWINTWKSNSSKRQTVFFLLVDPREKGHQGSWYDRLDECTTSCTIFAQCMEETSIFCDSERIDILSDSIECNHPSRNTSSLLCSKSCWMENWRSFIRKTIHVTSTSANGLITSRMNKGIGFESCSTTRRGNSSTTRSCSTNQVFPVNPTNSKSNSW